MPLSAVQITQLMCKSFAHRPESVGARYWEGVGIQVEHWHHFLALITEYAPFRPLKHFAIKHFTKYLCSNSDRVYIPCAIIIEPKEENHRIRPLRECTQLLRLSIHQDDTISGSRLIEMYFECETPCAMRSNVFFRYTCGACCCLTFLQRYGMDMLFRQYNLITKYTLPLLDKNAVKNPYRPFCSTYNVRRKTIKNKNEGSSIRMRTFHVHVHTHAIAQKWLNVLRR